MTIRMTAAVSAVLALACVCGCRVDEHKNGDGNNVRIATPFGGMQVKTNDEAVQTGMGLPEYPGATMVKKEKGKDSGAADVDMSFGSFHLRVKAVSYRTPDSPDKVETFYRTALAHYGDVIQCSNNRPVGTPSQTSEGLTCDNNKENHISVDDEVSGKMELKAGSKQHQHIVAIDKDGDGTKFGLVALDLPRHISVDDPDGAKQ